MTLRSWGGGVTGYLLALALPALGAQLPGCGVEDPDLVEEQGAGLAQALHRPRLGDPLPGLDLTELRLFRRGKAAFERRLSPEDGLGPVFIERSCVACHELGGVGGADALRDENHLVRRFGRLTGGVYDPMSAQGGDVLQTRSIARMVRGCDLRAEEVPADATILAERNPLQVFGAGLIDAIPDQTILDGAVDKGDGVHGRPNLDPTGRPGRFGWKAQTNTLLSFTAAAANGTLGLTTPLLPMEQRPQGQPIPAGCRNEDVGATDPNDQDGVMLTEITAWEALLAPPEPGRFAIGRDQGSRLFSQIGCAKCHTPALRTGSYSLTLPDGSSRPVPALSDQIAELYSDLLLHDMGEDLDEQVVMRQARGRDFRTAPLWGLGHRRRFLHDGRTGSLDRAIRAHGGEARIIRDRYLQLTRAEQSALIRFLRSL